MIEVKHLRKDFENGPVLKDVNCVIHDGDVISVIGPSGCGKSTFIRCLNLLEKPTSGEILINGKDIVKGEMTPEEVRKYAGMVFQSYNLYPQYTVLENVMVPQVQILKRTKQEAYDHALENLKMVDMDSAADKYPEQLSGGQKQRVAFARALAMDTSVLLLDEPTAALDPIMVREVQYVIRKLAKSGRTMLLVTHEMRLAQEISSRIFFMNEGVLYEEGTPEEIFRNPKRHRTRIFVNAANTRVCKFRADAFDAVGCVTEIRQFAERNGMTDRETEKLILLFEKTVAETFVPALNRQGDVAVRFAYSEMTGKTVMEVFYNGTEENLLETSGPDIREFLEKNAESAAFAKPENPFWKGETDIVLQLPERSKGGEVPASD